MRILLAGSMFLGLALGQTLVKGLTPEEVAGILQQAGLIYERTEAREFRLEVAGLDKVWLRLDYCQEERCGVLTLGAGFTLEEVPDLELVNAWNRDRRFSRAFLDEEGAVWVESDLDLTGGVSLEAINTFLELFAEEILPAFMEHIGFEP
ncbi:MAG: YbjN domain-containing protein [Thermus sp.]|nr:YbjN domain-containing protein [Thermus sp.]